MLVTSFGEVVGSDAAGRVGRGVITELGIGGRGYRGDEEASWLLLIMPEMLTCEEKWLGI